jgi:hypothetical protein
MRIALVLAALVVAAAPIGCGGSDDPFTADMKMICGAGEDPSLPPDLARLAAMRDIADRVRSAEAARLVAELIQAAPADRDELLAPALARAKLKRCRFFGR